MILEVEFYADDGTVVTAPLDRIRMLRQVQGQHLRANRISTKLSYKDWVKTIISEEGYLSLFKGCLLEVFRGLPFHFLLKSIRKGLNSLPIFKIKPRLDSPAIKQVKTHLVGTLANVFAYAITAPIDTLITRTTASVPNAANPVTTLSAVRDLIASPANFVSSFNGLGTCLIGVSLYRWLYMELYSRIQKIFWPKKNNFWIGYLSFVLAAQLTYPLDTIRRSVMFSNGFDLIGFNVAKSIYRQDGIVGFWGGSVANLLRSTISMAILSSGEYMYNNIIKASK